MASGTATTLTAQDRTALRDSVRRLLLDKSKEVDVRRTMETESGFDADLWRQLGEMGITGLMIDEEYGGSGVSSVELEAVMEEAGAALLCSPLLASSVITAELLRALGHAETNKRLLPTIASGECIACSVLTGDAGDWTQTGVAI
ncbi:MAG: acyl-CoA dehydrogenase family protein, partial [Proteobacteria bacterium]|nr:acyl-CoA dehydrogenase family protein [Pseudomonadota bacterium]